MGDLVRRRRRRRRGRKKTSPDPFMHGRGEREVWSGVGGWSCYN
jgi:hypothetical protein